MEKETKILGIPVKGKNLGQLTKEDPILASARKNLRKAKQWKNTRKK